MTYLYLARHAEQEQTPDEDPAVGISELGREQARLLGQRLRDVPFDGIHHSPLARAEQTARLVAMSLQGVPVHSSDLLTDRTPMPEPGREADYPERFHSLLATVPAEERDPGGAQITSTITHFASLGNVRGGSDGQPAESRHLLITHGFVIGWFVREALDAPVWRWLGLNLGNAGLTIIRYPADQLARLVSFNDVGHLSQVTVRGG